MRIKIYFKLNLNWFWNQLNSSKIITKVISDHIIWFQLNSFQTFEKTNWLRAVLYFECERCEYVCVCQIQFTFEYLTSQWVDVALTESIGYYYYLINHTEWTTQSTITIYPMICSIELKWKKIMIKISIFTGSRPNNN